MKIRSIAATVLAAAGVLAVPAVADAAPGGSISGVVRDSATGARLADVSVLVLAPVDEGFYGVGPEQIAGATTGADGRYRVPGLAASGPDGYWVCFISPGGPLGPYDSQCYDHATGFVPFPSGPGFYQLPAGTQALYLKEHHKLRHVNADLDPRPLP